MSRLFDTPIRVTITRNQWDSIVDFDVDLQKSKTHDIDWGKFVEQLLKTKHVYTTSKEETTMIIPGDFIGPDRQFVPAKRKGKPVLRADGTFHIGKAKKNFNNLYLLPVDIDGKLTIAEIKQKFKEYEYIAYTSISHQTQRKNYKDCVRLFILLEAAVSVEDYKAKKKSIKEWLGPDVDQSTVDASRGFFYPSFRLNEENNHSIWYNSGEMLDLHRFHSAEKRAIVPYETTGIKGTENVVGKILFNTLDIVAFFDVLGLLGEQLDDEKSQVTCPWVADHGGGVDSGSIIFHRTSVQKGHFKCQHSSCAEKTVFHVIQKYMQEKDIDFIRRFCEIKVSARKVIEMELLRLKHDKFNQMFGEDNE